MNSFGRIFKITLFGESHGELIGVTIDGVKPGISISITDFEKDLQRRRAKNQFETQRIEKDKLKIVSGLFKGKTTGAPLTIIFENKDIDSSAYDEILRIPRAGHADFVAKIKYKGYNDYRGGGIFSARLTVGLVAAGVVAKKIIKDFFNKDIFIESKVISMGGLSYPSSEAEKYLEKICLEKDTAGGIIETHIKGLEIGLGEPFFDGFESCLSHLLFSIPSLKAISFGKGIESASMKGSIYKDYYENVNGKTKTNNSGGINGGISNGNDIFFSCFFHPPVSLVKEHQALNFDSGIYQMTNFKGRCDTTHIFRIPVILEACCSIVILDFLYLNNF